MKRTLTLRKKETVLTQLEGVLAVKHRAARASRARAGFPIDAWGTQVSPPHSVDSAVFLEAGWSFSQARDDLLLAARSGATIPDLSVRQVCLTQSGRMLMVGDRLTVQLRESTSTSRSPRRLAEDRLSIVRCLPFENVYEVRTVGAESALDAAQRLDPRYYDFAEPIFDEAIGQRWRPTDPDYGRQWQWHNTGAGGGRRGADVGIERAWDRTRGERADGTRVRISVIDNGMDVGHVDLEAAIVHGGHYEDDGTGSTSFVAYRRGGPFPDSNHGTFCAGIAAARANNGHGGCGAAPECELIPVACVPDQVGSQLTLAQALVYASTPSSEEPERNDSDGADVIVCSLGPNQGEWELSSVLELALQHVSTRGRNGRGAPLFWAVSNGNFPIRLDEIVSHPSVIKVGRSTRLDLQDGSAFGPELDFLAPGVSVFSTKSGNDYGLNTGTSFAAPLAAGVAALVLAQNPELDPQGLRDRLRAACDKVGEVQYPNGRNDQYGFGRLNAFRAL